MDSYSLENITFWQDANGSLEGNNTFNKTDDYSYDYEEALGTFFWEQLLPPLFVYSLTFAVRIIGNSLIIFTIAHYRRLKSTTNVFLASLASADLLVILICIPVKVSILITEFFLLFLIFILQTNNNTKLFFILLVLIY